MAATRRRRALWRGVALGTAALMLTGATTAVAEPEANKAADKAKPADPPVVAAEKRQEVIGKDWQGSADRMWTTIGDQTGFHVMVATARTGYAWKTVATLNHPAVEADLWIGNACVTGSGDRAVVAYAPRTYTNKEALMARGAFTATVDLNSGEVKKLPIRATLAYFSPGCGLDETAVLTQDATEDKGKTGLVKIDAASGALSKRIEVQGQVTSAVPTRSGIVAAAGAMVQRIADDGTRTKLTKTKGGAFELRPDAENGVVYLEGDDRTNRVRRIAADATKEAEAATLASGKAGRLAISRVHGGKVVITGSPDKVEKLPAVVSKMDLPADAQLSVRGDAAVTEVGRADGKTPGVFSLTPGKPEKVHIRAKSTKTGKDVGFTVDPAANTAAPAKEQAKAATEPSLGAQALGQDMSEAAATCAIKRNDLGKQVYQPKPKQVEWAANWAVYGQLKDNAQRANNWHNNGQGFGYTPQTMFPPIPLKNTNNGTVPVQVLLGILGQESNLWQASKLVLPGEYANPLIGNYYGNDIYNGTEADDWDIDFSKADCGYGVSQTTDGMRLAGRERPGETALPYGQQVAVATDYAANVASGLRILQQKWNQLQDAGVTINNNDPSKLENWFGAVWAYNSGFHQPGEAGAGFAWGLGWGNNPANRRYAVDRHEFGKYPRDFATPQKWPYPEKVMGFAANPPSGFEDANKEVPFFNNAWWNTDEYKARVKPWIETFCTVDNNCFPGEENLPNAPEVVGEPAGPCAHLNSAGQYDLKCWWHKPATWKFKCDLECGNESLRYYPDYRDEPADGISSEPTCEGAALPGDAMVVDDVPREIGPAFNSPPTYRSCRRLNFADGTFTIEFGKDAQGREPSRIDLHQATSGYGGHFWFTHAYGDNDEGRKLQMKATWTLGRTLSTPVEVWVHQPKRTWQNSSPPVYTVYTADGPQQVASRPPVAWTPWVSLGTFKFATNPKVSLSSMNSAGNGKEIAFDAVAFVPGEIWPEDRIAKVVNQYTGKCLTVGEPDSKGRIPAVQKSCDGEFRENWVFHLVRVWQEKINAGTVTNYDYKLKNRLTGQCLQPDGFARTEEIVILKECKEDYVLVQSWTTWFGFKSDQKPADPHMLNSTLSPKYALSIFMCSMSDGSHAETNYTWEGTGRQRYCPGTDNSWSWSIAQVGG
ncbi:hypothetical protein SK803_34555 [Lentzea sp. BCCO 10_0856]|uniref:Uncharacterized protein n=1 Tax=Lentzea miocenica TaxID=3095431 RepID=A0ABU4TB22_9PSEU|nr:hypothetical protein [Lentzea sp. BCCO 10_0856]MDX8035359.1 hypothetical protein [Lentzea sp. BCCO 10_0856]